MDAGAVRQGMGGWNPRRTLPGRDCFGSDVPGCESPKSSLAMPQGRFQAGWMGIESAGDLQARQRLL